MSRRRGFSLIELMTVIFIIGVLASLAAYGSMAIMKRGRDTKRKTHLSAIAQTFQARYEDKACGDKKYPDAGSGYGVGSWQKVSDLYSRTSLDSGLQGKCNNLNTYLSSVPQDPKYNDTAPYKYNLSSKEIIDRKIISVEATHYRLGALLEASAGDTIALQGWNANFGGIEAKPKSTTNLEYNYFIGQ